MLSSYTKPLSSILKKDRASVAACLKAGAFDAGDFADFADRHFLSGALFTAISEPELRDLFPGDLIERFKFAYLTQWKHNERLVKEMGRLAAIFAGSGIDAIFLKGPLLALRFYGDIASRFVGDLDVLVKSKDIEATDRLLIERGFTFRSGAILSRKVSAHFAHHFEYQNDDIYLEIHWLLQRHLSYKLDYESIWEQAKIVTCNGKSYRVLSDEYELTLQMLSLFNDIQLGTAKLRTVLDILKILESITDNADWAAFFADRESERILSISVNMLNLALNTLEFTDRFPGLSAQIAKNGLLIKCTSRERIGYLFQPSRFAVSNKLWAWSIYDCGALISFCWWAISLPFRILVYSKLSLRKFLGR